MELAISSLFLTTLTRVPYLHRLTRVPPTGAGTTRSVTTAVRAATDREAHRFDRRHRRLGRPHQTRGRGTTSDLG
jgi:hypothetical protein